SEVRPVLRQQVIDAPNAAVPCVADLAGARLWLERGVEECAVEQRDWACHTLAVVEACVPVGLGSEGEPVTGDRFREGPNEVGLARSGERLLVARRERDG